MNTSFTPVLKRDFFIKTIAFIISISVINGCKKDDGDNNISDNAKVNAWVLDSMKRYYYWADNLPSNVNKDQSPIDYFNAIKNQADRFSYLQLPGKQSSLAVSTRQKFGFEYLLFKEASAQRTLGLVTMVMNNSPAQGAGLRRGQYFTNVNNVAVAENNTAEIASLMLKSESIKIRQGIISNGVISDAGSITVNAGKTIEQSAVQSILSVGGKKVGYLYFTGFVNADRQAYQQVFSTFKVNNITDLVLDLRYNAGGDVSAAAVMAALIAKGLSTESVFVKYQGNKNSPSSSQTFASAAAQDNGPSFANLQQRNLGLNRIFVLSTAHTASAAELMINNLRPYINVYHIGETTRGKDEASITITDKSSKNISWEINPIVYKISNSAGQGGYANGITPNYQFAETRILPLAPFGSPADPMIDYTLKLISSGAVSKTKARLQNQAGNVNSIVFYNSAVEQNGIMILNRP